MRFKMVRFNTKKAKYKSSSISSAQATHSSVLKDINDDDDFYNTCWWTQIQKMNILSARTKVKSAAHGKSSKF